MEEKRNPLEAVNRLKLFNSIKLHSEGMEEDLNIIEPVVKVLLLLKENPSFIDLTWHKDYGEYLQSMDKVQKNFLRLIRRASEEEFNLVREVLKK